MGLKYLENITEFLGKEEDRYFSNGFKHFDFNYQNLSYEPECKILTGNVFVDYKWRNKTNRHLHLGSVEYIAMSSIICEQVLLAEFQISSKEISSCWISNFKTKIQSSIELSEDTKIQISGKLISTEISKDRCKSLFEVKINTTLVKITIDHPAKTCRNLSSISYLDADNSSIYCTGYKKRTHLIKDVTLNDELMLCTASISIEDSSTQKSGIGSLYKGTLLTDIILISGQLVQALFYYIEKTDKNNGSNIWLKEFDVRINEPVEETEYNSKLYFEDVKTIKKGDEIWKSIQFVSELGAISSTIKMVSQIKSN